MKKLLIFDIDATLLIAPGTGKQSFERAFNTLFGISESWGAAEATGRCDQELFAEIAGIALDRQLSALELRSLLEHYLSHFAEALKCCPTFRLMPGVSALLASLEGRPEFALGIETGNLKRSAELKLEYGGILNYFSFGGFGCDSVERAEIVRISIERAIAAHQISKIDLNQVYVIGDAPQDIAAGRTMGVKTIYVQTGRINNHPETIAAADHVLPDLNDLNRFLACVA